MCLYNLLLSKQQPEQVFTQNQAVLLNHQVKFKNWYMLVLSQYHKFESYKINIYSAVANCHQYQRHRRQICHQCHWHRWQIIGTISGCRQLKVNLKAKIYFYVSSTTQRWTNKIIKIFLIEDFSICHRCRWHRWQTLSCEYLREFSKKFETALML